jgi:predicted acyl esterase
MSCTKLFTTFLFLLFTSTYLFAQQTDSAYVREHYTKIERSIPMRDGVKLFTAIYVPKAAGKYPFMVNRTPYTVASSGS